MIDPKFRGERVYVVGWPEHRIVKAGYTSQARWRSFYHRGATVHQLSLFDGWRPALAYESELHDWLRHRAPLAFASKEESRWLLGGLGGNCETYRLDDLAILRDLPQPDPSRLLPNPSSAYYATTPLFGVAA